MSEDPKRYQSTPFCMSPPVLETILVTACQMRLICKSWYFAWCGKEELCLNYHECKVLYVIRAKISITFLNPNQISNMVIQCRQIARKLINNQIWLLNPLHPDMLSHEINLTMFMLVQGWSAYHRNWNVALIGQLTNLKKIGLRM